MLAAGRDTSLNAAVNILLMRNVHKSRLPLEVVYYGDKERYPPLEALLKGGLVWVGLGVGKSRRGTAAAPASWLEREQLGRMEELGASACLCTCCCGCYMHQRVSRS
jgi:hypothetical protein